MLFVTFHNSSLTDKIPSLMDAPVTWRKKGLNINTQRMQSHYDKLYKVTYRVLQDSIIKSFGS